MESCSSERSSVGTVTSDPKHPSTAKEAASSTVPIWKGNFNVYWCLATLLGCWFFFVYTPVLRKESYTWDFPFVAHLLVAGLVNFVCLWNTFHTPSHGEAYRRAHVILGRAAVSCVFVGSMTGMICSHDSGRLRPDAEGGNRSIILTVGGIVSMIGSAIGMWAIYMMRRERDEKKKQRYLLLHVVMMVALLLAGCGIPALMRVVEVLPIEGLVVLAFLPFVYIQIPLMTRAILQKRAF